MNSYRVYYFRSLEWIHTWFGSEIFNHSSFDIFLCSLYLLIIYIVFSYINESIRRYWSYLKLKNIIKLLIERVKSSVAVLKFDSFVFDFEASSIILSRVEFESNTRKIEFYLSIYFFLIIYNKLRFEELNSSNFIQQIICSWMKLLNYRINHQ